LVVGALSLNKVQKFDPETAIEKSDAEHAAKGEQGSNIASRAIVRRMPYFLTLSAQFPYILVDAMKKHGIEAVNADQAPLPEGTNKDNIKAKLTDLGYSQVLYVGSETSREKGRPIFREERHMAANVATKVATLGLVPVHSSTFVLAYDRKVVLISSKPDEANSEQTFPMDAAEDDSVNDFNGDYSGRYAKALNAAQQKDAEAIVRWLDGVNGSRMQ